MIKIDASREMDPDLVVKRRSQWSVVFTLVVSLAGLLAVLLLGGTDRVADARALWDSQGHASYEFEVWLGGRTAVPPSVRLAVLDGDVVETAWITPGGDGAIVGIDQDLSALTVDRLFDLIDGAMLTGDGHLEFDPVVGYPTRGRLDPDPQAFDDEREFGIVNFVAGG